MSLSAGNFRFDDHDNPSLISLGYKLLIDYLVNQGNSSLSFLNAVQTRIAFHVITHPLTDEHSFTAIPGAPLQVIHMGHH